LNKVWKRRGHNGIDCLAGNINLNPVRFSDVTQPVARFILDERIAGFDPVFPTKLDSYTLLSSSTWCGHFLLPGLKVTGFPNCLIALFSPAL